ncbi:MAG: hypothetical protein F4X34_00540 [Chloroflexi bacterium]|nr:hypothetical protein [Chloroflexota bacterium]
MFDLTGMRLIVLVLVVALIGLHLVGCGDNASNSGEDSVRTIESVRGMVLEVEQESLISLAALEIQDEEGKVWRFEGRGKVIAGFTPSHLNEHKLLGQSVEVAFYREDDLLVLDGITD